MIDTITLRIHDISLHADLERNLKQKNDPTKGFRKDHFEEQEDIHPDARKLFGSHITYFDTGKVQTILQASEFKSSYHYAISNRIDYHNDYIELSFSIPKYIYSTNIVQFIPHFSSPTFLMEQNSFIEYNLANSYQWLRIFLNRFFQHEFPDCKLEYQNVEINRIDLCYNQVFNSKDDALTYLNDLRKIRKKFSRNTSRMFNYTTSFSYVSRRYSFKIYHKGTEYRSHDRQKHNQINRDYPNTFDVERLQEVADNILRYEATFRGSYLAYAFEQNLFKPHCEHFQSGKTLQKDIENHPERIKNLDPSEKFLIKLYRHYTSKKKTFMWKVTPSEKRIIEHTDYSAIKSRDIKNFPQLNYAPFSEELFSLLCDKFKSFLDEFRVLENISTQDIVRKAEEYNHRIQYDKEAFKGIKPDNKHKVNIMRLQLLLDFCKEKNYTFSDLKHLGFLPKSTYYLYLGQLKKLGVSEKNLTFDTINVRFDLRNYHSHILENAALFRRLNFLQ